MSESLWVDIDNLLVTQITGQMGISSPYTTYKVATVVAHPLHSVRDWEGWTLPAVVVVGVRVDRNPGPHDSNGPHYDKRYPYGLVAIVEGTRTAATLGVKLLEKRLEIVCKGLTFSGLLGDDGERVQKAIMQATPAITLHPKPNCEDVYYAVAAPLLEIRTFV
jgi:hypothetical protein